MWSLLTIQKESTTSYNYVHEKCYYRHFKLTILIQQMATLLHAALPAAMVTQRWIDLIGLAAGF